LLWVPASLPLCGVSRGRCPRSLLNPGRAARCSRCRGRELLGAHRHGCSRRLLCGLRRRVFSSVDRLTRPLAGGMAGVDIRRRAKGTKVQLKKIAEMRKSNTYRSERRWVAVNLLLVRPVGTCAPDSTTRGAGGSPATRSAVVGPLSGRL